MITKITLDLTDNERRQISGTSRCATRKEVVALVHALVSAVVDPAMAGASEIVVEHEGREVTVNRSRLTCTAIDHCYPLGPKLATTPCFCGRSMWGSTGRNERAR